MANWTDTKINIIVGDEDKTENIEKVISIFKSEEVYKTLPDFGEVFTSDYSSDYGEIFCSFRWSLQESVEGLAKICKDNAVAMRIISEEEAMGFTEVVCISEEGEVVQNQGIDWAL